MLHKLIIRQNKPQDSVIMFDIWESSVKATHHFLTADDIQQIGLQVKEYLENAVFLVVTNQDDSLLGFMGMTENKVDSLFIHPDHFGQGIGKYLIHHVRTQHPVLLVDVNEDNHQAKVFYEKLGFRVFERTELDDAGRPFPILKMILDK